MSSAPERLAKRIASSGYCSRRDAEKYIFDGLVTVNGIVCVDPATKVTDQDEVMVRGKKITAATEVELYIFHKPAGVVITKDDPEGRPTYRDYFPRDLQTLNPVGRLDMMTEGLLLLTNNGAFKRYLEMPAHEIERRYEVRVYGRVSQSQLDQLVDGIEIDGVFYHPKGIRAEKPAKNYDGNFWLEVVLTEGKNREIRNIMDYLGLRISRLIRVDYGPFALEELAKGAWYRYDEGNLESLFPNFFHSHK